MLVEIPWKPSLAAFHAKDAGYNLVSFSLLLHATCFLMIELLVASNTIYLKSGWGKKTPNSNIAIVTYSSCSSL